MGFKVAVVGATGNVGREMLTILAEREFPGRRGRARSPRRVRSAPRSPSARTMSSRSRTSTRFDFKGIDIVLFSPGAKVSAVHSRRARPRPAPSSSTTPRTSAWTRTCRWSCPRSTREAIAHYDKRGIIANPELLDDPDGGGAEAAARPRARSSAWSSRPTSRSRAPGRAAMDELFNQTRAIYVNDPVKPEQFTKQIAFNVHSAYRRLHGRRLDQGRMEDGGRDPQDPRPRHRGARRPACACRCSSAMPRRSMSSSSGRSPRTRRARRLRAAPGVSVIDHRADEGYVTPAESAGEDAVYVSRIRTDPTVPHGLIHLGRRRQSAQGRRAQRGADRRNPGARLSRRQARLAAGRTSSRCDATQLLANTSSHGCQPDDRPRRTGSAICASGRIPGPSRRSARRVRARAELYLA